MTPKELLDQAAFNGDVDEVMRLMDECFVVPDMGTVWSTEANNYHSLGRIIRSRIPSSTAKDKKDDQ